MDREHEWKVEKNGVLKGEKDEEELGEKNNRR